MRASLQLLAGGLLGPACVETAPRSSLDENDIDASAETEIAQTVPTDDTAGTGPHEIADSAATETDTRGADAIDGETAAPTCTGGCGAGTCVGAETCDCGDSGFSGARCETPVCAPPCVEGTCIAPGTCDCTPGFIGPTCAEAASCGSPCLNGGLCVATDTCDCSVTGFGGPQCAERACNGVICPEVAGYDVDCNGASHCEYVRAAPTAEWHADDVWIHVPPGAFTMGSPNDQGRAEERPQHHVSVPRGFLIGKLELSVRTHMACADGMACDYVSLATDYMDNGINLPGNGRSLHPQNGLRHGQAASVCAFLGGRLPTEAEWELAANGPGEHRVFPWGNGPTPECGVHAIFAFRGSGCGSGGTAVIGQRPAGVSPVGALDMVGNLDEWVEDCWHDDHVGAPGDGSAWVTGCASENRVVRGGSYVYDGAEMRTAKRSHLDPTTGTARVGVRCARDVDAGPP